MDEYTLVKKSNLEQVAEAIRQKGGTAAGLEFPGGFVAAIMAIETTPPAPTTETLTLTFDSGTHTNGAFTGVGHYAGVNYISKWSFKPSIDVSSAMFTFVWANKTADGGPGEGYNDPITMAFTVGGKTATYTLPQSAPAGLFNVTVSGLALKAGTSYVVTVKESVYGTTNNFKMFKQAGNTVKLTT